MQLLTPGMSIGAANPKLWFAYHAEGLLLDVDSLTFAVDYVEGETRELVPEALVAPTLVDVSAESAARLGPGFYVPSWTVPAEADLGRYRIVWTYRATATSPELSVQTFFEVVAGTGIYSGPFYCALSDVRAEGFSTQVLSDAKALAAIQRASAFIAQVTGRYFEPRYATHRYNGRRTRMLLLQQPIVALASIGYDWAPYSSDPWVTDTTLYRVYNRHITGLLSPDDRDNPKIELASYALSAALSGDYCFPYGQQNIYVTGFFGYTDPDGSPWGQTPEPIRRATLQLALRDIMPFADPQAREEARLRGRLVSERTRDQEYKIVSPKDIGLYAGITGDPEIDMILRRYKKPLVLGAA